MPVAMIYPTNKVAMLQDVALAMYILHGLVITPEISQEYYTWSYYMPWSLKYPSEKAYDVAVTDYVSSAPVYVQQIHAFMTEGIGKMPAELVGIAAGQTPEEQWLILQQLDLEDSQRKMFLLCFKCLYGVVRNVTRNWAA